MPCPTLQFWHFQKIRLFEEIKTTIAAKVHECFINFDFSMIDMGASPGEKLGQLLNFIKREGEVDSSLSGQV